MWLSAVFIVFAYLAGSLSSAIIVCRMLGLDDPRTVGSGNPGTTNVLRHFGKKPALLTLAGDVLKGLLPIVAARLAELPLDVLGAVGVAAFIGHLFPIFFKFQGGKGVATFIGVLLGFAWPVAGAFIGVWLLVAMLFRYSSLAGMAAAVSNPAIAAALGYDAHLTPISVMVALIIWRHRSNIRNLLSGEEGKIGVKSGEES